MPSLVKESVEAGSVPGSVQCQGTGRVDASRSSGAADRTPEELAIAAQHGSLVAYGALVELFQIRLFNFLLRRTNSRHDAEELTQEAFVRAWERIATYDSRWRFSTWLFTIGARLAISDQRKRSRARSTAIMEHHAVSAPMTGGELDSSDVDAAADRRLGAQLWALAAEHLTEDQQTALWLRYAEGMEIIEIATVLGKSRVGVRVCLFRARQSLLSLAKERSLAPASAEIALAGGAA
jgi:RNA polymerase sigma-70 factor (ECF subfamily)